MTAKFRLWRIGDFLTTSISFPCGLQKILNYLNTLNEESLRLSGNQRQKDKGISGRFNQPGSTSSVEEPMVSILDSTRRETIEQFACHGIMVRADGSCSQEIRRRIGVLERFPSKQSSSLYGPVFSLCSFTKGRPGQWTLKRDDCRRLLAVEMWCYRRLLKTW